MPDGKFSVTVRTATETLYDGKFGDIPEAVIPAENLSEEKFFFTVRFDESAGNEYADKEFAISFIWKLSYGEIEKHTVKFTDGVADKVIFDDVVFTVDEGSPTPDYPGTPTREGYIFKGWNPALATKATENVTYTAQWQKDENTYSITFTDGIGPSCRYSRDHGRKNGRNCAVQRCGKRVIL